MTGTIAGYPAELQTVDLRTYRSREDCIASVASAATTSIGAGKPKPDAVGSPKMESLDLFCVAALDTLVDRDALLRDDSTSEPPYWALVWTGARAIAARLLSGDVGSGIGASGALDVGRGAGASRVLDVLDLGCGVGAAGIAAGLVGAKVTFADLFEPALEFARANVRLHAIDDAKFVRADFTRDRFGRTFDGILAADIIYDPRCYGALVDFLDVHLAPEGTLLLTQSLRADARVVLDALSARGIDGTSEAIWLQEEGRAERTCLHTLGRRA